MNLERESFNSLKARVLTQTRGTAPSTLNIVKLSAILSLGLAAASWVYVIAVENASLNEFFSRENLTYATGFISQMLGNNANKPAFLEAESWRNALFLSYETLQMSVLAISFAGIGMLLTVIPAARTARDGSLTLSRTWYGIVSFFLIRSVYTLSRAVPELIVAMIIVFIFKPGILPGALALGLHNFGILGKLCAEVVEDIDLRPSRALRSSGASTAQILLYSILPAAAPKFLTYMLYRWEVIIRTTIIVGFVGAAGLGRQFKLSMSWFHYTEVTLLLFSYLLLVVFVDLISGFLRRLTR